MPFKKGASGNPSGRPKIAAEVKELARKHGQTALNRVVSLMQSPDERVSLAAAQEVMNRAYGKATQPVEGTDDGPPIKQVLEVIWAGQNTSK